MNKYSAKNRIIFSIIYIALVVAAVVVAGVLQYRALNKNYNRAINNICNVISESYPEAEVSTIVKVLNSDDISTSGSKDLMAQYGIDINKDSAINANKKVFIRFLAGDILVAVVFILLLLIVMNSIVKKWDGKIEEITEELSKINAGDYSYDMNSGEEGKLSILESEIYKTAIKSRESAENSRKDKENLKESLSDISHQLKTPITSLTINLDTLEEYPDLPEEKRMMLIGNAKRDVNKVNQMVQMLLKLSRLDADAIEFVKKNTPVDTIILKAAESVLALCDLKGINLYFEETELDDEKIAKMLEESDARTDLTGVPILNCDPYWETEALANILKNGAEHATTKVCVFFTEYETYSEIVIENDGEQISHAEAQQIFTRYYRGESAVIDSVGIGLSLADSIVRRDGGYIMAEAYEKNSLDISTETGTRFIMRFMH